MSLCIPFTIMAAFMQAIRTAAQKSLAERASVTASTLARSIFALPFAWAYCIAMYQYHEPIITLTFSIEFYCLALLASVAQVGATYLMVQLFSQQNFAIGICYAKTEAILVAVLSVFFFKDQLSGFAWLAISFGTIGIIVLSPVQKGTNLIRGALLSPTALLGLTSGLGFAITSLAIRQAGIGLGEQFILNAAITLACVISLQSILMGGYLVATKPSTIATLFKHWKLASFVGVTSMVGSIGWFTAMTLENAALVKTLGQIEFFFALILSAKIFKERHSVREYLGMALVIGSVILILFR